MTTPAPAAFEEAGQQLARQLAERATADAAPAPAVAVLGGTDLLRPEAADAARLRAGATVHLTSQSVLIGPWGGDPDAVRACGTCLAMRWQRLRSRTEREALETGGTATLSGAGLPPLPDHAVDAVWALHRLTTVPGRRATDLPQVSRLDLETLQVRTVPLLAEPLCPSCVAETPPTPPTPPEAGAGAGTGAGTGTESVLPLVSRPRPFPGSRRLRSADSYPLPEAALANPVCGVLGAGTWSDVGSPTTAPVAGTVFMRGYAGLTDVTWSGQANSFRRSRALAFLEGLERYAGTHRRDPAPLLVDSYRNLGAAALDPRTCGLYAPRTYREDPMLAPFDPDRPIPWVEGWSLRDEAPVLVPARLCYYSAGTAADNFVFECSNGCATGSCPEEAILYGLLELIERDAFLLGWYGNAQLPEIDLTAGSGSGSGSGPGAGSGPGPALRGMLDRAALLGYDVHAFDNRIDLSVPVVTALAVRRDGGPGTLAFAAAAGLDPADTIESAVSEILTYIPHLPGQVRERPAELAAMAEDFDLVRRLPDHAALFGLPQMARHARSYLEPAAPARPAAELYADWDRDCPRGPDLLDDLLFCRDQLTGAGYDVIAVDQTTPEQRALGLHTVCTIVPGLLPIDFGWTRQRALHLPRLRTALRRGGLRDTDLSDAELRLVPHPFP
ncbi:TOMM precursor leader peptide-binding protein [Kitasatospora sp. NA04385]|uniref:TOMM precursor leader peptide-binding protein n=1 Tax=Kitasatospora sp. NA04385 TaxID=2742135 RepID=UPI00158FA971|nr:TOMM precursor leader peptide-binding protein [Kitasatospora sp. NA04385]QKW18188.1 TOMM precursor leader peptide-binding protein [Kitasatospora sp. NA04385]